MDNLHKARTIRTTKLNLLQESLLHLLRALLQLAGRSAHMPVKPTNLELGQMPPWEGSSRVEVLRATPRDFPHSKTPLAILKEAISRILPLFNRAMCQCTLKMVPTWEVISPQLLPILLDLSRRPEYLV